MARVIVELYDGGWIDVSDMTIGEVMEKLKAANVGPEDVKYTVHYIEGLKILPNVKDVRKE